MIDGLHEPDLIPTPTAAESEPQQPNRVTAVLTGYESDFSDDDPLDDMVGNEVEGKDENAVDDDGTQTRQWRKLDIPARIARQTASENQRNELKQVLVDIESVVKSRKTHFEAGAHGLQAYRAQELFSSGCP